MLYEVKSSQDKGLGLFATQIIPKGTRILSEKPLIKIARTDLGSVVSIFGTLSEEDKTFIKSLYCLPAIFVKRKSELERQRAGQSTAMQIAQILATFQTNCFRLDTVSGQYSGLFREASRINHACADNVFCYWNNESGEQTIHAIKVGVLELSFPPKTALCRSKHACTDSRWRSPPCLLLFEVMLIPQSTIDYREGRRAAEFICQHIPEQGRAQGAFKVLR